MTVSPEVVAWADQRTAAAAEFLDLMTAALREEQDLDRPDDAMPTLVLSDLLLACYRRNGSHPETTCDALALALRRLAAS